MNPVREILYDLIGIPLNIVHTETVTEINAAMGGAAAHVSQVIEYDLEYIFSYILVLIFFIGTFKLLSNFQKSFSTGRRAKR